MSIFAKRFMSVALSASLVLGGVALFSEVASARKAKLSQSSKAKSNTKNKISQNAKQSNSNSTHQHAGGGSATGGVVGSVNCVNTGGAGFQIPILGVIVGPGNACGNGNGAVGGIASGGTNVNTNAQANANAPINLGNQNGGTAASGNAGTVADTSAN